MSSIHGGFVVARISGSIHKYTLPHIALECKYLVKCRPLQVFLNIDGSKLGVIDINGVLSIIDCDNQDAAGTQGKKMDFERKDI